MALAGFGALLAGSLALSILAAALFLLSYFELRRLLGAVGSRLTLLAGAAAVVGFVWIGQADSPEHVPWVLGALVLALLALRVLLVETGKGPMQGATDDVAATVAAAGIIGVLGAHVLLIRALPRWGFVGLFVFGVMLLVHALASLVVTRVVGRRPLAARLSEDKTWEGAFAGLLGAVVIGVVAAFAASPPFGVASGALLGLGVGVLAPVGDLIEDALKRGAGVRGSAGLRGADGVLDALDGPLFCAPFFYWVFRTLVI